MGGRPMSCCGSSAAGRPPPPSEHSSWVRGHAAHVDTSNAIGAHRIPTPTKRGPSDHGQRALGHARSAWHILTRASLGVFMPFRHACPRRTRCPLMSAMLARPARRPARRSPTARNWVRQHLFRSVCQNSKGASSDSNSFFDPYTQTRDPLGVPRVVWLIHCVSNPSIKPMAHTRSSPCSLVFGLALYFTRPAAAQPPCPKIGVALVRFFALSSHCYTLLSCLISPRFPLDRPNDRPTDRGRRQSFQTTPRASRAKASLPTPPKHTLCAAHPRTLHGPARHHIPNSPNPPNQTTRV